MDWIKTKLKNLISVKKGDYITKDEVNFGIYPVILGGKDPAYYIDKFNHEGKAIVIARSGAAGLISFWNEPIFVTDGFIIDPIGDMSHEFLYILLKYIEPNIQILQNGATIQHITPKLLYSVKVSIPPFEIQEKITNLVSTYDALIKNNTRRIAVLEKMAQEIYKEWFVRFRFPGHEHVKMVNGVPEGWPIIKIKKITTRLPFGTLYSENDVANEGNVIVIDQSTTEYVGFHNDTPSHVASLSSPIIIFGDHSCKLQLMICPFSLSENVVPFIGNDSILTIYFYYELIGKIHTTEYKRHWGELMNKKILLPPIHLQKMFSDIVKPILMQMHCLKTENRNLIKQRDLLLPRLMSGKLELP